MLYHDDPGWFEQPGQTVEIPLGPAVTSRRFSIDVPWQVGRYDAVKGDHLAALIGAMPKVQDLLDRHLPLDQTSLPPSQLPDPQLPRAQQSTEAEDDRDG